MKIKSLVVVTIEYPDGATHYTGWLGTDDVTYYKWLENSTGTVKTWCYWSDEKDGWLIASEHPPHFLEPIPFVVHEVKVEKTNQGFWPFRLMVNGIEVFRDQRKKVHNAAKNLRHILGSPPQT